MYANSAVEKSAPPSRRILEMKCSGECWSLSMLYQREQATRLVSGQLNWYSQDYRWSLECFSLLFVLLLGSLLPCVLFACWYLLQAVAAPCFAAGEVISTQYLCVNLFMMLSCYRFGIVGNASQNRSWFCFPKGKMTPLDHWNCQSSHQTKC